MDYRAVPATQDDPALISAAAAPTTQYQQYPPTGYQQYPQQFAQQPHYPQQYAVPPTPYQLPYSQSQDGLLNTAIDMDSKAYTPTSAGYESRSVENEGSPPIAMHAAAVPVESSDRRLFRTLLPAIAIPLLTAFAWAWGAATVAKPIPLIGVGSSKSTELTYGITLLSTVLAMIVSWGFGRTVTYYVSKRVADRPCSVDEVGSWVYLGTHQIRWTLSRWLFATGVAAVFLGLQVSGFNAILQPQSYNVTVSVAGRGELDYTSSMFSTFYTNETANGYPDCFWPEVRGISTPSCTFSSGFFELLLGGRAAVSQAVKEIIYSRVGPLSFAGPTGGVLPFTKYNAISSTDEVNSFNLGTEASLQKVLKQVPKENVNSYAIKQELQGISADINCQWSDSSPLESSWASSTTSDGLGFVTTTTKSCDPAYANYTITQYAPQKRAFAYNCASEGNLYIRLFDAYRLTTDASDPTAMQENLTCSVAPFVSTSTAIYSNSSDTTVVTGRSKWNGTASTALQTYLSAYTDDLERAVNNMVIGETSQANLVVEAVTELRPDTSKNSTQDTWSLLLTGMVELDSSFVKNVWSYYVANATEHDASAYDSSGWRSVPIELSFEGFGWHMKPINLLFLIPLSLLCVASVIFTIKGMRIDGPLLEFDPSDIDSLMLATSRGNLGVVSQLEKDSENLLKRTKLRFRPNVADPSRPWGLSSSVADGRVSVVM